MSYRDESLYWRIDRAAEMFADDLSGHEQGRKLAVKFITTLMERMNEIDRAASEMSQRFVVDWK